MKKTRIVGLLFLLTAMGADCPGTGGPAGLGMPALDGTWEVSVASTLQVDCWTFTGGHLTSILADCRLVVNILSESVMVAPDGSVTVDLVMQDRIEGEDFEGPISVAGVFQADGTIAGQFTIDAIGSNGTPLQGTASFLMRRR